MAALTAALELSEGDWRSRFDSITVYQRGWRLGGKGASSRGPHGRIEEHGLHILLGYYDETFDVMRRCYEELDRRRSDPACPILTWDDAVAPSNLVGVTDRDGDGWVPWVAAFRGTGGQPGRGASSMNPLEMALRSVGLLLDFFGSLPGPDGPQLGAVQLTTSPEPPARVRGPAAVVPALARSVGLTALAVQLGWARRASSAPELERALSPLIGPLRSGLRRAVAADPAARRTHELVELVATNLAGIVADGLLTRPETFKAIDGLDYRDWLCHHGIDPAALESALLRGMYDLVFAYEGGDPARPRFSAGLGLELATRMLLGYSGALFWRMQAGMGEVVFAPMYEVLRSRGVEFRFFHRVDALRLSDDGRRVGAIELGIQAEPISGAGGYEPLVRVKGLPCWPDKPLASLLRDPGSTDDLDFESFWSPRRDVERRTLVAGRDFDAVVFGISLGMVRFVCADLVAHSAAWRAMVDRLGTVATQSFQLWLCADEQALGWRGPEGVTMSGFAPPFDTWASMSHLLPAEDWPDGSRPGTIAYFCGALTGHSSSAVVDPAAEAGAVRERAHAFLDGDLAALWPGAVDGVGFRWDLLCDGVRPAAEGADGPSRLDSQYWRANVDPSDLYVQSLPGTGRYRLPPGGSGFDNLFLAGDWTDCGLNAGCVEAATRSGRMAAEALIGADR
jgi:uncharacterized protein with NAD-binding domain and iron-sulfur cluster